jgi:dTMP kinase
VNLPATAAPTGVFVCFEGGEGSGKSTQARLLETWLSADGYPVLLTFEPGDTQVGKELRRIVLSPETGELSHRTEALLYAADKAEHVDTVVQPALDRGEVVVTDRYVDSTLAYQGAGRDLDVTEVERVARWATHGLRPHLTVVLDLDPAAGHSRFEGRDRIEGESTEFFERVRAAFLEMPSPRCSARPGAATRDRVGRPGRPAPDGRDAAGRRGRPRHEPRLAVHRPTGLGPLQRRHRLRGGAPVRAGARQPGLR